MILLLNLLIAMMGDTYAKIAEIKNEWMRQWARTVLITERSISPAERLRQQDNYCDKNRQVTQIYCCCTWCSVTGTRRW